MRTYTRVLAAFALAALSLGPLSVAAAAHAQAGSVAVDTSVTVAVTGKVHDNSGAPVAGVTVALTGVKKFTAVTAADGSFSFPNVVPGLYRVDAVKAGFQSASEDDYAVALSGAQSLDITLHAASFSQLQTIASVRTTSRSVFNTSTASVGAITAEDFQNQGQPQVMRLLNQIPGVQASFPSSSANAAVPGAITYTTIRGALGNETASLIDGHPVSVGGFGDYVTTFLNSFMMQGVEVVKGPGAMASQTNYAIGGTVNFRTKDPTLLPTPELEFGVDNHSGSFSNFGFSDTIDRLGFVVDIATINDPSVINNTQVWFNPAQNAVVNYAGPGTGTVLGGISSKNGYVPGTASQLTNTYGLVACCYSIGGSFNNVSELVKLRYKLSSATTVTASYLGSQTTSDQSGNTTYQTPITFSPPAGYTGPLAANSQLLLTNVFPGGSNFETNNEPIFQGEIASALGNDTILARYYHASIYRIGNQGPNNTDGSIPTTVRLFGGVNPLTNLPYNGQNVTINYFDFFNQNEIDKLTGYSFEYDHPLGLSNVLSATWNSTSSQTTNYTLESDDTFGQTSPVQGAEFVSTSEIPTGSGQVFNTYMLRDRASFGERWDGVLSLYQNTYKSTYPFARGSGPDGGAPFPNDPSWQFQTTQTSHLDERLGLTYRATPDLIVRAAAGSAIAPPYLNLLSAITSATPSYSASSGIATQTINAGTLKPETAFGYDLGADLRLPDAQMYVSADIYLTDLYNHFISQTFNSGLVCGQIQCGNNAPNGAPIFYSANVNLNNARYEGIEAQVRRIPLIGLGFNISGSLQRGFAYNLPKCFYSNNGNCLVTNTNLGIVPGQNFSSPLSTAPSGYGFGSFGNTNIPYFQGNAEVSYRFPGGIYTLFGDTLYGHNNSLNEKAFGIAYATVRVPLANSVALQVSGDNIFNAYSSVFPIFGGGVPVSLAASPVVNGATLPSQAATYGNVLGPANYRFIITKYFGNNPR